MKTALLHRWLLGSEWRHHPLRLFIAMLAIAIGVALGYAIDLVNQAASNEFSAALQSLSGQSDLQVRASTEYFDETVYPWLASQSDITNAYPVLEIKTRVPGQRQPLTILGIDVLRAGRSDLIGQPAQAASAQAGDDGHMLDAMFAADSIFLSNAAQTWLGVQPGQFLQLGQHRFRVAGGVLNARTGQRIAVMDIGTAQWRFGHLGQLSRIELRLQSSLHRGMVAESLEHRLAPRGAFSVTQLEQQEQQASNMSRAYRVNLSMLAMIALLTGAFLVFSNQALSVMRRRPQFALLRVLGWTRRQLLLQVLTEGMLLGSLGSMAGVALGFGLAWFGLHTFGADLGAGYFAGLTPQIHFVPHTALLYGLLGTAVALAGCAMPAWQTANMRAAISLKGGEAGIHPLRPAWPGFLALTAAAICSQLPSVAELPLFAYTATALLLCGSLYLMPHVCHHGFAWRLRRQAPHALHTLALARLANTPSQASIALGGLLTSFSLMVAMAVMVTSFRVSLTDWLEQVLPADLYLRTSEGTLDPGQQQALMQVKGVARIDWEHAQNLRLDPARPPVSLLARAAPARELLSATWTGQVAPGVLPVWVSEAMPDLYGMTLGKIWTLPLGGKAQPVQVVGIWRDYARQFGSIILERQHYQRLSLDNSVNGGGIWLQPGFSSTRVAGSIKQLPFAATLELAEPGLLRRISLTIFDRSFAITYVLEAVAILIGLFGVASSFSAQTLARTKEFGMLRHLGYGRAQILRLLALEGAWLGGLGVVFGFVVGYAISLILVFVINPQSFHWHMSLAIPWRLLALIAVVLCLAAAATAVVAGRKATGQHAIAAVREDW